jgi:hypothetical protein
MAVGKWEARELDRTSATGFAYAGRTAGSSVVAMAPQ